MTIARYYTPAGHSIQNVGIIPDVWLQPVFRETDNANLFGAYRYKNERFLHNHLEVTEGQHRDGPVLPAQRAYYLTELAEEGEDRKEDRELEVAMRVIDRVHKAYPGKLPAESVRASHWLGLAGPSLKQYTEVLDNGTRDWLKQKFQVSWDKGTGGSDPNLELKLNDNAARDVAAGESLPLAWTLTNRESQAVSRLSVFVRSEAPGFETKEILIGALAAGETRQGTLDLRIPADWTPGTLLIRVGVAADAWPTRAASEVELKVFPRAIAELTATAGIADERGGQMAGVLETKEQAKLRVTLTNEGEVAATNLKIKLFNLAGTQLKIAQPDAKLPELAPGETKTVDIAIAANKTLYAADLSIGLFVEGTNLKTPLRQKVMVRGHINGELSRVSNLMSH